MDAKTKAKDSAASDTKSKAGHNTRNNKASLSKAVNPLWHRLASHTPGTTVGASIAQSNSANQTPASAPSHRPSLVQRMCAECEQEQQDVQSHNVQTKLTIGAPNDPYEQEADTVADRVMRMSQSPADDDDELSEQAPDIQRSSKTHEAVQRAKKQGATKNKLSRVQHVVNSPGSGSPISNKVRTHTEPVLNADLSGVRVHSDTRAQQAAQDINAKAFTQGNRVFLGAGQSGDDLGLMAHELTHTVQQGASPELQTKPNLQRNPSQANPAGENLDEDQLPLQRKTNTTPTVQRFNWPDISLPSAEEVVETVTDVAETVYETGEAVVEGVTDLSFDDLLSMLETGGEAVYGRVVGLAHDLDLLADLLNQVSTSERSQLLAYVDTEWLVPILNAGNELARYIIKEYWPDNAGWIGNFIAQVDAGIDLSDLGFPVKLLLLGGTEIELSLTRLGTVVTAYIQTKDTGGIGLSGTIKAVEVLGRVVVKELEKWQAATDLNLIEWSTDIITHLRTRNVRGIFAAIWSQAQSFWDATQFEYTYGASAGLELGGEIGLNTVAVAKAQIASSLGFRITAADPTPHLPGRLLMQGQTELSGSLEGDVPLANLIPQLSNLLQVLGRITSSVGIRIEWRIPSTEDTEGEVSLQKVSLFNTAGLELSAAHFTAQGQVSLESEIVLWNNGALLPDIIGMLERLASGDPLTPHDIESMIPFQELNFEVSGMGRYAHLVNIPGLEFIQAMAGGFLRGSIKMRFSLPRYRVIAMIRRNPESLGEILRMLLAGNFLGALRQWADTATENVADIVSSVVSLTVEVRRGGQLNARGKTEGHGDISGIGGFAVGSLGSVRRHVFEPSDLRFDQIEQLLRDLVHAPPGGDPQQLEPTPEQDAAAERAKALRQERDETDDPARQRELDERIEETLGEVRPDLETMVISQHPSLTDVDPDRNLYKITIDGQDYYGTLEALLDFQRPSNAVRRLGEQVFTRDMISSDASLSATGGLAGTSSQGRTSPYPGDVDLGETIRIEASSASAASQLLASSIQQTITRATEPRGDGRPRIIFLNASFGHYPLGHPSQGNRIRWTQADIERGYISWIDTITGRERQYSMADALERPGDRAVNTFWRGPIDSRGTFGEITKVMTYEAFHRDTGEQLFGTPEVGQAFQTVSFGAPQVHDTDRAALLTALIPQIQEYFDDGKYLKSVKRAYTVARMLNDIHAINDLAPLMAGTQARLRQLIDHLNEFTQGIANPEGVGIELVSQQEAKALAEDLVVRTRGVDVELGEKLAQGLRAAGTEVRGNATFYALCNKVVKDLSDKAKANTEYRDSVDAVLTTHGYLDTPNSE